MSDVRDHLLAGWLGGVVGFLAAYPCDTIKTLQQQQTHQRQSALHIARHLLHQRGVGGLYRGAIAPAAGVGLIYAFCFALFAVVERGWRAAKGLPPSLSTPTTTTTTTTTRRTEDHHLLPLLDVAVCGGIVGFGTSMIQGPAELLKVRQQAALAHASHAGDARLLAVMRHIYVQHGIRGFWAGTSATLCREVPGSMVWFGVYEGVKRWMHSHNTTTSSPSGCGSECGPSFHTSLLAGGLSGAMMWIIVMPTDVVKTAMQAHRGPTPLGWRGALQHVLGEPCAGFPLRRLYVGLAPAVARAVIASAATFVSRDAMIACLQRNSQPQDEFFCSTR